MLHFFHLYVIFIMSSVLGDQGRSAEGRCGDSQAPLSTSKAPSELRVVGVEAFSSDKPRKHKK